jgi:hypothetical protein
LKGCFGAEITMAGEREIFATFGSISLLQGMFFGGLCGVQQHKKLFRAVQLSM